MEQSNRVCNRVSRYVIVVYRSTCVTAFNRINVAYYRSIRTEMLCHISDTGRVICGSNYDRVSVGIIVGDVIVKLQIMLHCRPFKVIKPTTRLHGCMHYSLDLVHFSTRQQSHYEVQYVAISLYKSVIDWGRKQGAVVICTRDMGSYQQLFA